MKNTNRLDDLLSRETAFANFDELLTARGNYRPSIKVDTDDRLELADAYDAAMAARGDDRRAYRYGEPTAPAEPEVVTLTRSEITEEIKSSEADLRDVLRLNRNAPEVAIIRRNLAELEQLLDRAPFEKFSQVAQQAKKAARQCIESCRNDRDRFRRDAYFLHRGVDVVAVNAAGERCGLGDPVFLEVHQLSGVALKDAARQLFSTHGEDMVEISIQGGVDAFESFAEFMRDCREFGGPGDYDPQVDEWEVHAPADLLR